MQVQWRIRVGRCCELETTNQSATSVMAGTARRKWMKADPKAKSCSSRTIWTAVTNSKIARWYVTSQGLYFSSPVALSMNQLTKHAQFYVSLTPVLFKANHWSAIEALKEPVMQLHARIDAALFEVTRARDVIGRMKYSL